MTRTTMSNCYSATAVTAVTARTTAVLFIFVVAFSSASTNYRERPTTEITEYCERDIFRAECNGPDEVILITHALYGRMRNGKCISSRPLGCYVDVRQLLDASCSGRRRCMTTVATLVPDHSQPCHADYRSYLEAAYECIKVVGSGGKQCRKESTAVHIGGGDQQQLLSGYLSSVIAEQSGCGSYDSPWRLVAPPGLRLRFFLLDFAPKERKTLVSSQHRGLPICQVYAVLREESTLGGGGYTICGGESIDQQQRLVYTSQTATVDVRLVAGSTQRQPQEQLGSNSDVTPTQFLLKYELFGCTDPMLPRHGGLQRTDNDAFLWCNETGEQWQLKCDGNQWIGTQKNCSTLGTSDVSGMIAWETLSGSKGVSVILILVIAFTVGLFMVVIGSVYLHRLRVRRERTMQLQERPLDGGYYSTQQQQQQFLAKHQTDVDSVQLSENDYYKSWQLHQQSTLQSNNTTPLSPYSDSAMVAAAPLRDLSLRPFSEHIYESPKFDKKDDIAFDIS